MEDQKTDLSICLGSSCFARGNKKLVQVIKQFLASNHLEDKVFFHGNHCFGECGTGPNLKIGDVLHHTVNEEIVLEILKRYFRL